ncbi:hypothetical protein G9A89_018448 [Geosiphon pyriformis]|nr:hypothetical protein G9A89_018448 [Geosiphon pyriformis]
MHSADLQAAMTNTRDFEAAKLEANHAQAVNLVMNGSSELDSKLKQFITSIIFDQSTVAVGDMCLPLLCTISTNLPANDTTANISTTHISTSSLSTTATSNILTTAATNNLLDTHNQELPKTGNRQWLFTNQSPVHPTSCQNHNSEIQELATITENKLLDAIFPFELEKLLAMPLFSGAILKEKPITTMYTNAKVDSHLIKLILDSRSASTVNAQIIMADEATKTPISEIDNFSIEVNSIIVPIKVLLQLSQNGQYTQIPATCGYFKTPNMPASLIEFEKEEKKPIWEAYQVSWANKDHNKLPLIGNRKKRQKKKEKGRKKDQYPLASPLIILTLYHSNLLIAVQNWYASIATRNCYQWVSAVATIRNARWQPSFIITYIGGTCDKLCQYTILISDWTLLEDIQSNDWTDELAPTRKEQEQWLEKINARLCDFQYCNKCDLNYNPPICIIYMIPEKEESINSCTLELELNFNPSLNSDNNDKNNGSSFALNNNETYDDSNSDSNSKTFIALSDLTKEQELKWFSNNGEGIRPECAHNTDAEFDLRYPGKNAIKLEPYLCTCIDLKIALKILATTMVQLISRSSLAKKGINIKREIIDTRYVGNIIAMLQNNSKKAYIIDLNEKIAQAIFLSLVKTREELGITAREIQKFGSTSRINISVNMAEKEVINKEEIISTHQSISIPLYDQYILAIKKEVKNQAQLFETEATICKSGEIGLTNLYILAKSPKNIKIFIYNTTGNIIKIPKETVIGYLTTEVKD